MLKLNQIVLNNIRSNAKGFSVLRYDKFLKSTVAEAKNVEIDIEDSSKKFVKPQNRIVAAAFAALHDEIKTPVTDEKINKAANINELLSISDGSGVSRRHALKVVSTLAEWSTTGKAKLTDFENDARFIKLCKVLSKGAKINRNARSRSEDLSTVLNITADDEAARLISSLTLPQMIKVMNTLSIKKRRSVLLLRTLAYNMTATNDKMDLKQCADVLYSMCLLNFVDINLLAKICDDISIGIRKDVKKSSVIGSIITSLGLLKYKNCDILDTLSEWILQNQNLCRSQDIFSLFVTLATLNHLPNNSEQFFQTLIPQMSVSEARKPLVWLNFVWSLVILNQASPSHFSSVLIQDFYNLIEGSTNFNVGAKIKLLNVNAAAQLLADGYKGNLLSPLSHVYSVNIVKTRENAEMTKTVVETLKNLITSESLLKVNTNTRMGFHIDAECIFDKKCNPLPFNKDAEKRKDVNRIAIMVYDYHNMSIGKIEPTGANILASKLLRALKYQVMEVPYTEFKTTDKLVQRVQYLENRLKAICK